MYNRSIVDATFTAAGVSVQPAIKVNSIFTIALRVMAGSLCSVLPDALAGTVRGYCELKMPLTGPEVRIPIGFMSHATVQLSHMQETALSLGQRWRLACVMLQHKAVCWWCERGFISTFSF